MFDIFVCDNRGTCQQHSQEVLQGCSCFIGRTHDRTMSILIDSPSVIADIIKKEDIEIILENRRSITIDIPLEELVELLEEVDEINLTFCNVEHQSHLFENAH